MSQVLEKASVSPEPLLRSLIGFEISQVLMAAHHLGVFEALADGPMTSEALCWRLNLAEGPGGRLLQACVALSLLDLQGGQIANSAAAAQYLDPARSSFIGGLLDYYRTDVYPACARLPEAILENRPQVAGAEGGVSDIFSAIEHQSGLGGRFHQAMHGLGLLEGQRLAGLFPFDQIDRLLDVGGGSGALVIALAQRYPTIALEIFDRPEVCREAIRCISAAGLGDRIRASGGDFWKDPIPSGADAILLSMVLHDWNREEGLLLLRKCAAALPAGGSLLIYEQLLDADRCGPSLTCLTNLLMLLRTRTGSEYTEADYRTLLQDAGFSSIEVVRTPGIRHLLHAKKQT